MTQRPSLFLRGTRDVLPQYIAAFLAAWFGLGLLNRPRLQGSRENEEQEVVNGCPDDCIASKRPPKQPIVFAGASMDLTLFAVSRAAETLVRDFWTRRRKLRQSNGRWTALERIISRYADSWLFATSAGTVMWAWFYLPDRLPQAYNAWIRSAAEVDHRLVEVLRRARFGDFVYGKDTGQAPILQDMCKDYNWPLIWGDPSKTIPIPCDMVHMGSGPSCHWHALVRFWKAFRFALVMYLPLQLLLRVRHPSLPQLQKACREAARSSAFLGAFVSLFYYGVCLSRTQLGPKLVSKKTVTPMMWDSGLCVRAGCLLCGWSILIEAEGRRQELAMFVVPRAAATLFPREYDKKVCQPYVGSQGKILTLPSISGKKGSLSQSAPQQFSPLLIENPTT